MLLLKQKSIPKYERISQILVLPPYQKSGHGGQFMEAIYETAQRKDYAELNVEDPSDGFQFLRDLKDLSLCHREGFFDFLCDRNFAEPLSGPLRRSIKAKLKITDVFPFWAVSANLAIFAIFRIFDIFSEIAEFFIF